MNKATLEVRFYKTDNGIEPVRDWLRELPANDRKIIRPTEKRTPISKKKDEI